MRCMCISDSSYFVLSGMQTVWIYPVTKVSNWWSHEFAFIKFDSEAGGWRLRVSSRLCLSCLDVLRLKSCNQNVILITYNMWFSHEKTVIQCWYMPGTDLNPKLRQLNWYRPPRGLIVRNFLESLCSGTCRNADLKSSFVNFLLWLSFVYRSSIFGMGYNFRLVHLFMVIL